LNLLRLSLNFSKKTEQKSLKLTFPNVIQKTLLISLFFKKTTPNWNIKKSCFWQLKENKFALFLSLHLWLHQTTRCQILILWVIFTRSDHFYSCNNSFISQKAYILYRKGPKGLINVVNIKMKPNLFLSFPFIFE